MALYLATMLISLGIRLDNSDIMIIIQWPLQLLTTILIFLESKESFYYREVVRGMVLIDEIRGRLAEVFSLKTHKIDHVVHGAIASIATYGALMNASVEEIESAIGIFVAHYIPFRAIRAGKQLSDSKGASAALSTEAAIQCINRAIRGFSGPKDIFRNPEAIFRLF